MTRIQRITARYCQEYEKYSLILLLTVNITTLLIEKPPTEAREYRAE